MISFLFDRTVRISDRISMRVPAGWRMSSGRFYAYEEDLKAEIVQHLPKDGVFVDVGAHLGWHSLYVARLFPDAQVHAFDLNPELQPFLSASKEASAAGNLSIYSFGLGDRDGKTHLILPSRCSDRATSKIAHLQDAIKKPPIIAPIRSLDSWVAEGGLSRLDLLKIDVAGGEWDVLDGARKTLLELRPILLIELDPRGALLRDRSGIEVFKNLASLGYQVRGCGERETLSLSELRVDEFQRGFSGKETVRLALLPPETPLQAQRVSERTRFSYAEVRQ